MDISRVAVFWDYEGCPAPPSLPGYLIVENIRRVAHHFGIISLLKAYLELPETSTPKNLTMRSELQSSGVSLIDCPHNGRKEVADKMIIVDMLAFILDNPAPATIMLISGDRDVAYCLSLLRQRKYNVCLIVPKQGADITVKAQASSLLEWQTDVLRVPDICLKPMEPVYGVQSVAHTGVDIALETTTSRNNPQLPVRIEREVSSPIAQNISSSSPHISSMAGPSQEVQQPTPLPQHSFDLLIDTLEQWRLEGNPKPLRSRLGDALRHKNPLLYGLAGVSSFKDYISLAEVAGIVSTGGLAGSAWITLNASYQGRIGVGTRVGTMFSSEAGSGLEP